MNRANHENFIKDFLNDETIGQYDNTLGYDISTCDESDDEFTSFVVEIYNLVNKKKIAIVLRSNDDGTIEYEDQEDFYNVDDDAHFFAILFIRCFAK